jgi:hypothetical protein
MAVCLLAETPSVIQEQRLQGSKLVRQLLKIGRADRTMKEESKPTPLRIEHPGEKMRRPGLNESHTTVHAVSMGRQGKAAGTPSKRNRLLMPGRPISKSIPSVENEHARQKAGLILSAPGWKDRLDPTRAVASRAPATPALVVWFQAHLRMFLSQAGPRVTGFQGGQVPPPHPAVPGLVPRALAQPLCPETGSAPPGPELHPAPMFLSRVDARRTAPQGPPQQSVADRTGLRVFPW